MFLFEITIKHSLKQIYYQFIVHKAKAITNYKRSYVEVFLKDLV